MSERINPVATLSALKLDTWEQGDLYRAADASFGGRIGLRDLGVSYNEVPVGKSGCPFHNHHVEDEMFVILEGEADYRFGDTIYKVKAGDVLGAPAGGPEYAHQLINTGAVTLRYLGVSTMANTEVCEYPDSGKFLVSSSRLRAADTEHKLRFIGRAEASVDYWDGEPGA